MQNDTKAALRVLGVTALLQLVWVPVAVIDAMERHRVSQLVTPSAPSAPLGRTAVSPSGVPAGDAVLSALLLNASDAAMPAPGASNRMGAPSSQPSSGPAAQAFAGASTALPPQPTNLSTRAPADSLESFRDPLGILRPGAPAGFSTADLLGGPLTLASSREAAMPVLARAERARWATSGDPLAPLPAQWRTPMRQAVKQLAPANNDNPTELSAQVVHIPSTRVRLVEQVPVAIRDDGTATLLRAPNDKSAMQDIESWASRQPVPKQGAVATALVTIHPLPEAPTQQRASQRSPATPLAASPVTRPAAAQASLDIPDPPPLPTTVSLPGEVRGEPLP
jgi:hypothetical protein